MKKLVKLYTLIWLCLFLAFFLFRSGVIPQGLLATNEQAVYFLELFAVVFSLGEVYVAFRLLAFSSVKTSIHSEGFPAYKRFSVIRIFMLTIAALFDLAAYFLVLQSTLSFCLLVVLAGLIFVKPSQKELDRIMNPDEKTSAE